jgi:hypothetical protein
MNVDRASPLSARSSRNARNCSASYASAPSGRKRRDPGRPKQRVGDVRLLGGPADDCCSATPESGRSAACLADLVNRGRQLSGKKHKSSGAWLSSAPASASILATQWRARMALVAQRRLTSLTSSLDRSNDQRNRRCACAAVLCSRIDESSTPRGCRRDASHKARPPLHRSGFTLTPRASATVAVRDIPASARSCATRSRAASASTSVGGAWRASVVQVVGRTPDANSRSLKAVNARGESLTPRSSTDWFSSADAASQRAQRDADLSSSSFRLVAVDHHDRVSRVDRQSTTASALRARRRKRVWSRTCGPTVSIFDELAEASIRGQRGRPRSR